LLGKKYYSSDTYERLSIGSLCKDRMRFVARFIFRCFGAILVLFSAFGVAFAVHALIDPAGAKLSDDGDPFGMPAPVVEVLLQLQVLVTLLCVGFWICCGKAKKTRKSKAPKAKATSSFPHPPAS
jgi:hypothetical protein